DLRPRPGGGAAGKRRSAQLAERQAAEHRVIELDRIAGVVEVGHGVDVRQAERAVEDKRVVAGAAVQRVVAGAAVQRVVAAAADPAVVDLVAGRADAGGCGGAVGAQGLDLLAGRHGPVDDGVDDVAAFAGGLDDLVAGIVDNVGVVAGSAGHRIDAGAAV